MFRFPKSLDIVTLFHKSSNPASVRVATLLKELSASAAQTSTVDSPGQSPSQTREEFELDITENTPTEDQVKTILEYVGPANIPAVIKGASNETTALKLFKQSASVFQRPVVVDWNNGKAVVGDNESEILKALNALKPKEEGQ